MAKAKNTKTETKRTLAAPAAGVAGPDQPKRRQKTKAFAPWPHIDRFPIIIGSNITFQYLAACMRNALSGYRQEYVDLLNELLDHEPHTFSQAFKRVVSVAGGAFEVSAIDADDPRAVEICEAYKREHERIPRRTRAMARLAWAMFYGVTAEEILWERSTQPEDKVRWHIGGLQMIHSRRLSYPEWMSWDLYVWDGGALSPSAGTVGGLKIADYPNKFVVHEAGIRADYPTRDGLGRILVTYMALKRLILRTSAAEFERFIKPWVVSYFHTGIEGHPRIAQEEDIASAKTATEALGQGYSTSAVLPDSVKIELIGAVTTLDRDKLLEYLDSAITRAVNGQSLTATQGKNGSRSANEVGERDEQRIHRFDAANLCDTWREGVVVPWVKLNFPGDEHLAPVVTLNTGDDPDPMQVLETAGAATDLGVEVDADRVAKRAALPIAKDGAKKLERPKPEPPPDGIPPGKGKEAGKPARAVKTPPKEKR
jgi:phage gp29-like protein